MAEHQDWSYVGERIRAARVAAGLTQNDLGGAIGLDRTMVAKIEAGGRRVDALELVKLSAALSVSMAYFIETQPLVLSRRTVPLTDDTETEAGRESSTLEIALEEWLRDIHQLVELGLLQPQPIKHYPRAVESADHAREAAKWLRKELGLGTDPVASMVGLAERAGQFILVSDLPGDGASVIDGDIGVAVVSKKGAPGRRRATAAHELGHLVLGDEYSTDLGVHASRADRESVIDAFAAELLVPSQVFAADAASTEPITRERLVHVAALYRASWSLTLRQAAFAGVKAIPKAWGQSNPTHAEFLEALGFSPQPDLDKVRVPPSVAQAVMQAWRSGLITRARALELMHGEIEDQDLPAELDVDLAP
ncbi:helix-turn-helix domain-containing protein [Dactylosporangium matsuzakiense]|nr:XRE family transcriptional regulator [Dactylosporangium matsuzakiense]UWZ44598.1 ImmA/IrrE family metallo-endopeptidase [Dactylosporangium matsuzakiense]